MNDKVEGTVVLDGLIEGKMPDDPDFEDRLNRWIDFTRERGLCFSLETTGNSFSLLTDNRPVQRSAVGESPEQAIVHALEQLLEIFPLEHRRGIFSTLRSSEYRSGEEVQAVYLVRPDGSIKSQDRVVETRTIAAPKRLSLRQKLRLGGIGLLIALALFGISALFVDYRTLIGELGKVIRPLSVDDIATDAGVFEEFIRIKRIEYSPTAESIVLEIESAPGFPADEAALERIWKDSAGNFRRRLAIEAIARGTIRCELFDPEGRFLESSPVRIRDLRLAESIAVKLPLPKRTRIGRIVLVY